MSPVTCAKQVFKNIEKLQSELPTNTELVGRLGMVHAWYIDDRNPGNPKFGFSKYIGYKNMDGATYLNKYNQLDGRVTEYALSKHAQRISPDSEQYGRYYEALCEWLSDLGKTPRKSVRLMRINTDDLEANQTEDRRILDLIIAVADTLPTKQRLELRQKL